jgi:ferric-dicitrate binding protein FerR (iron transport regulator)
MIREDADLQRLLEQLGTAAMPVVDFAQREQQRQRVVRAIDTGAARAHERSRLQAQWRRRAAAFAVAAAVVLAVVGWSVLGSHPQAATARGHVRVLEGAAQVLRPGQAEARIPGECELGSGDLVRTAVRSEARLALATDVRIELFSSTSLRLGDAGAVSHEDVWLPAGKGHFDVAKRGPAGVFSVHTPDTDVTVHGTSFTVEVGQTAGGVLTSVSVTEGLVAVQSAGRTIWLGAGGHWVSRAEPAPVAQQQAQPATTPRSAGAAATPSRAEETVRSTLPAENHMFLAAMAAKRGGDDAGALRQLDAFLAQYPASPLAQNARVERFRVLARLGRRDEAAAAARRYMAEHPDGFARDEARGLALAPASPAARP